MENFFYYLFLIPAIAISLSVHEFMHAYVAYRLGDPTAKMEGRLTLNPLAHIDPIGLIALLSGFIGWAKPVPIDPIYFKNPDTGKALVTIAGPLSNMALAVIFTGLFKLATFLPFMQPGSVGENIVGLFFSIMVTLNIGMALFNLIPIPPLDGSRIVSLFLSPINQEKWESFSTYSPFILIALFIVPGIPILSQFREIWYNVIKATTEGLFGIFGL